MINDGRYPDYPLFKGLQRPLELMGLQGRYIYWAAGVAGGAIVGFIAAYCLMGFVAGLVVLATVLSAGIVLIILKQRKGLHSKNVINMFQKFKRMCRKAKKTIMQVSTKVRMLIIALLGGIPAMAQSTAGDYSAGTTALSTVAEEIVKYVPVMVKLCYAIAGVVAIIGAISVYIAMNNEEQDVKKKIMMVVGACLFLIAAAQALPLFFGINA